MVSETYGLSSVRKLSISMVNFTKLVTIYGRVEQSNLGLYECYIRTRQDTVVMKLYYL